MSAGVMRGARQMPLHRPCLQVRFCYQSDFTRAPVAHPPAGVLTVATDP